LSAGASAKISLETIDRLLSDEESTARHVVVALRLLLKYGGTLPEDVAERPAIQRLPLLQILRVTESLQNSRKEVLVAAEIVKMALERAPKREIRGEGAAELISLALPLIGGFHFREACNFLESLMPSDEWSVQRRDFNLAMAKWGCEGAPSKDLFAKVISNDVTGNLSATQRNPNYHQCLALAFGVLGNQDRAIQSLSTARTNSDSYVWPFSCWSYLARSALDFGEELTEMRAWIGGRALEPAVFRDLPEASS